MGFALAVALLAEVGIAAPADETVQLQGRIDAPWSTDVLGPMAVTNPV